MRNGQPLLEGMKNPGNIESVFPNTPPIHCTLVTPSKLLCGSGSGEDLAKSQREKLRELRAPNTTLQTPTAAATPTDAKQVQR